jgi:hypothetical protein
MPTPILTATLGAMPSGIFPSGIQSHAKSAYLALDIFGFSGPCS